MTPMEWAELFAKLEECKQHYESALGRERIAHGETVGALKSLNAAQKAIDDAVHKARHGAAVNTDWYMNVNVRAP